MFQGYRHATAAIASEAQHRALDGNRGLCTEMVTPEAGYDRSDRPAVLPEARAEPAEPAEPQLP